MVAWQVVRTRYGDDVDPQAISGLFREMPQFAVLFSLLALAAMGLPPFGVFAGFIGMLFDRARSSSVALLVMMVAWLAASWYILTWCNGYCLAGNDRISAMKIFAGRNSHLF